MTALARENGQRALAPRAAQAEQAFTAEDLTDLGNGLRFVRLVGRGLRFVGGWRRWLIWDGRRWEVDPACKIVGRFDAVLLELLRAEARLRKKAARLKIELEAARDRDHA